MKTPLLLLACITAFLPSPSGLAQTFGFVLEGRWSSSSEPVRALVVSPTGRWAIAVAGRDAIVFDLESDRSASVLGVLSRREEVLAVAVSPDETLIALVDASGTLELVERPTLKPVATVTRAHEGEATAVAFTSDGSYVVTGGGDGRLRVWTTKGVHFADLSQGARHRKRIAFVANLESGRRIISVGRDGHIILWDVDTQRALRPTQVDADVLSAALGGDGKTLVLGLQRLSGAGFRSRPEAGRPGKPAQSTSRLTTRADDRLQVIDAQSGTQVRDLEGEEQDLDAVAVTPDGRFIAAAGSGGDASIWLAETGRKINSIPFEAPVTALAFAPDGRWMLAGTRTGDLALLALSGVGPAPVTAQPKPPSPIVVVIIEPAGLVDRRGGKAEALQISASSLRIRGRVRSSSPIKSLLVDGREITSIVADDSGDLIFNAVVSVPEPGPRHIEVVAENETGTLSHQTFFVERTISVPPPAVGEGRRIALIVGISHYADSKIDLRYAAADAQALRDLLVNPALGPAAFRSEDVRLLLDGQATVGNITKGLREFLRQARENDLVLFFFAGHGAPDPGRLQDLYLLAHDTMPDDIAGTGLLMRHVREALAQIPARDVLILTDSCHAAGIGAPDSMRSLMANPIHETFLQRMRHSSGGLAILTASEAAQLSYENEKWDRHGVFTHFLLEGLGGGADADGDRIVSLGEVMEYVRERVRDATQSRQIPAIGLTNFDRDLPLVVVGDRPVAPPPEPPRR